MAPGIWNRVTGGIVALAGARAAGDAVTPVFETTKQRAWGRRAVRVFDPATAAAALAQELESPAHLAEDAKRHGLGATRFDILTKLAYTFPGLAELDDLTNRGIITNAEADAVLTRLGYPEPWRARLIELFQDKLTPAELAVMVQRTVVPNPGLLPNQPDTSGSNVPPMPVVNIDVLKEAAAAGIDRDRLAAMARIIGLPASPDLAARMHFRGIITEGAFNQAIVEGNTRGEWAPFLLQGFRDIPSARDYIQGRLRGWIGDAAMYDGAARHGMEPGDVDLLFKVSGRPISFRQVFIGERRGGSYGAGNAGIAPAFLKSLEESNIRPEWYQLAWAQRHTYPSAFVLRALVQSGDLSADEGYDILLRIGWPETLARTVADRWGGGTATTTDPAVRSVKTAALTRIRDAYVQNRADQGQVEGWLGQLGYDAATTAELVGVYDVLKTIPGAGLTRAQLKKAFKELPTQWPRDRTLAELEALGMEPEEAQTFLDE